MQFANPVVRHKWTLASFRKFKASSDVILRKRVLTRHPPSRGFVRAFSQTELGSFGAFGSATKPAFLAVDGRGRDGFVRADCRGQTRLGQLDSFGFFRVPRLRTIGSASLKRLQPARLRLLSILLYMTPGNLGRFSRCGGGSDKARSEDLPQPARTAAVQLIAKSGEDEKPLSHYQKSSWRRISMRSLYTGRSTNLADQRVVSVPVNDA
jgi:hypothetical protein